MSKKLHNSVLQSTLGASFLLFWNSTIILMLIKIKPYEIVEVIQSSST